MTSVGILIANHSPHRTSRSSFSTQTKWPPTPSQAYYATPNFQFEQVYATLQPPPRTMASTNPAEMEAFQRLSDQYQPEIQGPLVGEKLPMDVLIREYAQADPTYVAKTTSLATTHSAYRPIKGDGQCGWRAAVFGYFEVLLQSKDLRRIAQERARLRNFDDTMRAAGIDVDILIDMFDSTYELFDRIKTSIKGENTSESILLEAMNDEGDSSCILYHFKSMTSAWMQLNSDRYEPFLEMSMIEYRQSRIDPSNQEIDQIGLQALTDSVIGPAGIALDVSYLDRSIGDEVTPHQFVPNEAAWPTIRLLYRPGHYDMLYQEFRAAPPIQPPQVNVVSHIHTHSDDYYSAQPIQADMFLHTLLSPNDSVWSESYRPLQNHPVSAPTSYNNLYSDQYSYSPTSNISPMEPPPTYSQPWTRAGSAHMTSIVASPTSPFVPTLPNDESDNEPKIRRNNYSLLVHNHIFPAFEPECTPGESPTSRSRFDHPDFTPEQYHPDVPVKKQSVRQKRGSS